MPHRYDLPGTSKKTIGAFTVHVDPRGIGLVVFSRPPVNAVSVSVYEDLTALSKYVESDTSIRVVVLTAPDESRAWCGGADLNDFVGMTSERRKDRYRFINEQLPHFQHLGRPVIAAINGATIGIGMIIAGLCDMRVAAEDATFACPEVDYGLVGGAAGLFDSLRMPGAKVREMYFTGRRFTARELESTGFFNYVLPRHLVLPEAMALAELIARKSRPVIEAQKQSFASMESRPWMEAYLEAQAQSARLAASADSGEGVRAFLEGREPTYRDR